MITGQDCCDLCASDSQNNQWISYVKSGTSTSPECRCYSHHWEAAEDSMSSDDWGRGSCLLPVENVYAEIGF